jgi:hypothetical protein
MAIHGTGTKAVTTAGIPERLSDYPLGVRTLDITALSSNSGTVYVGDRNVSSTQGQELVVTGTQGDTITLTDDPYNIWLDVGTGGDGVKWLAYDGGNP